MRTNHRLAVTAPRTAANPLAAWLPAGNPRHLQGAWSRSDLERIGSADRVLVLGAACPGLDVALALDECGHRGPVRLVSPHGLLLGANERIAPEAPERLAALRAAGRLDVVAGRVGGAEAYGDTFVVDILPHGRTLHSSERYDWIVSAL